MPTREISRGCQVWHEHPHAVKNWRTRRQQAVVS
jgi:hypothetical protein